MKKIILILVMIMGTTIAYGFDGNRKGFIVGVGAGLKGGSHNYSYNGEDLNFGGESESGLGMNFKLGYAPSEDLEIYWSSKTGWFKLNNTDALSGVAGLGITRYLITRKDRWKPAIFLTGGLGYSTLQNRENIEQLYTGSGYYFGLGYEFSKHYSIEFNITRGKTKSQDDYKAEYDNTMFLLTFNALAY